MNRLFTCYSIKPFTMTLEGFIDSNISERDYIDLCCSIRESLDFCICVTKVITEISDFQVTESNKKKFSFHVTFPEHRGTKAANKKFVLDNMVHLLEVVLEDDLPVMLEGNSGTTYALIKVP